MNATLTLPQTAAGTLADLVLVRYTLRAPRPKQVRKDVGKLLGLELPDEKFNEVREELASAGLLSKGPRAIFAITEAGRQRAFQFLGVSALPARANWGTLVNRCLFPKAAGLSGEAAATLKNGDQLAAFLLKRKYGLSGGVGSSVKKVMEALVCKQVGHPEETTLEGLLREVLSKLLGSPQRLTKDQLAKQLPLFGTGLSRVSAEEARRGLVRDWLTTSAVARTEDTSPREPLDLAAFASTVRALAAGSPPEDRFHDNKVFIAALWRASQREPNFPRLSLPEFKQRLLEANARHLLHLSRADLVQEMDPDLVAESEIAYLNATFHFVRLEEARP